MRTIYIVTANSDGGQTKALRAYVQKSRAEEVAQAVRDHFAAWWDIPIPHGFPDPKAQAWIEWAAATQAWKERAPLHDAIGTIEVEPLELDES